MPEPGPEKCHAEFISASLSGSETLKLVQGDNIVFPLQATSDNNEKTSI